MFSALLEVGERFAYHLLLPQLPLETEDPVGFGASSVLIDVAGTLLIGLQPSAFSHFWGC